MVEVGRELRGGIGREKGAGGMYLQRGRRVGKEVCEGR